MKMSVHVDDPLVMVQKDQSEFCMSGWDNALLSRGLETFDSVRGLKYLGMVYFTTPNGHLETTPSGYIEGMASLVGVTHAKTPTTPGIRPRQPTEAEEKPVDERQRVFRAFLGKAQWILRARIDVLYAVKELSRRLPGPREVDNVAAKRMVKYLYGTRDTVLQLMPRKGTLRLDSASDSDWDRCPSTRKSHS